MHANGSDRRGQGGANATIFSKLTETNGGTRVEVDTDYHITGRLARFGRGGMIEDISERLLRDFAKRLQDSLAQDSTAGASEAAPEAAPVAQEPEPAPPAAEPDSAGSEPAASAAEAAASASEPEPVAASPEDVPEPVAHEQAPDPAVPEPEAAPPPPPGPESAPAPEAAAPPPPPPPPPPQAPAEPLDAGSLVGSVMWDRAKKNPAPFVAGIIVVILFLLRRRRRR
jgi:hypothetical protein